MDFFSRSRRVGETEGSRYIGAAFPEELVNFLRVCSGERFAARKRDAPGRADARKAEGAQSAGRD